MSNVIEFSIKAIDDFSTTMAKATDSVGKVEGALIGAAIAAGAYVGIRMARASLDNAEAMGLAAQKASMSVEAFSALAWAAKMSNVETSSLTTGMKFLSRAMSESGAPEAKKALQALGVSTKDPQQALMQLADHFAKSKDGAEKTAAAMAIFGRSGTDMVPLLNQGSAAMRASMLEAKALGQVITNDFAPAADQINDNLAKMSAVMTGSVNAAMEQLAPSLEAMTTRLVDFAVEGDTVARAGRIIASGFKLIVTAGLLVVDAFDIIGTALGAVAAAMVAVAAGEFSRAWEIVKLGHQDAVDKVSAGLTTLDMLWANSAESVAAGERKKSDSLRATGKELEHYSATNDAAAKAAAALADGQQKIADGMSQSAATFGWTSDQIKVYELALGGASDAVKRQAMAAMESSTAQQQHADALAAAQEIIMAVQTPLEAHNAALEKIIASKEFLLDGRFDAALEAENERWMQAQAAVEWYGISVKSVSDAIGRSMAEALVEGTSLAKGLESVAKNVAKAVIGTLIQIGVQKLVLAALDKGATASVTSQKMAAGLGEVFVNSFASAAAIPIIGWAMAPGVAAANTAIASAGIASSMAAGAGLGAMAGAAHGGLGYVPSESTYLLDKGERVISPRQNTDLTSFLEQQGSGGGTTIQNLTIHVLENATNIDAFARMDKIQLRNALGQPVIDALNEMFNIGQRPNFAMQMR